MDDDGSGDYEEGVKIEPTIRKTRLPYELLPVIYQRGLVVQKRSA